MKADYVSDLLCIFSAVRLGHRVCWLLGLVVFWSFSPVAFAEKTIELPAIWKVSAGDDERWAAPEYDDGGWQEIAVPSTWGQAGFDPPQKRAWYRNGFRLPVDADLSADWYLVLGQVGTSADVYLNGQLIGKVGDIDGRTFFTNRRKSSFHMPSDLLQEGQNHLAVRVVAWATVTGLADSVFVTSDASKLIEIEKWNAVVRSLSSINFGVVAAFFAISFALLLTEPRRGEFQALALFEALYIGVVLSGSGLFEGEPSYWSQELLLFCAFATPLTLLWFTKIVMDVRMPRWVWWSSAWAIVVALLHVAGLDLAWKQFGNTESIVEKIWVHAMELSLLIPCVAIVVSIWRGLKKGAEGAAWLLVGIGAMLLTVPFSFLDVEMSQEVIELTSNSAAFVLRTCLTLVAMSRFRMLSSRVGHLSERILTAHEVERSRLSRELHDGVAQGVQSLQLQSQRIGAAVRSGDLQQADALASELASDSQDVMDDLRAAAHDLHPSVLEKMSLAEALESHVAKLDTLAAGPKLVCEISGSLATIAKPIEGHLYRIAQECLKNAITHSGANVVQLTLDNWGYKAIRLRVEDDGLGEAEGVARRRSKGIGLIGIKERVDLCGGFLEVFHPEEDGTCVEVKIPLQEAKARAEGRSE